VTVAAAFLNDVRLQIRQGLYTVYAVIAVVYIVILRALGPDTRTILLPLLVFLDPSMLGFFFVGGIVLLERNDRILFALFTTPMTVRGYFLAKIGSLTLLATLASLAISVAAVGAGFRPLLLAAAVVPTAALFTLLGLGAVSRFRTVSEYLIVSSLYMLPAALPFLDYFGIARSPLFYLIPSHGALRLTAAAFAPALPDVGPFIASGASLLLWLAAAWIWAAGWFRRYVVLRVGEET
jgi:fluoroquinolone transport system permease protein